MAIVQQFDLDPNQCRFIYHYPWQAMVHSTDGFEEIRFTWKRNTMKDWRRQGRMASSNPFWWMRYQATKRDHHRMDWSTINGLGLGAIAETIAKDGRSSRQCLMVSTAAPGD